MDDYFQRADWRVLKEDKETGAAVPDYVTRLGGKKGSAIICAPLAPSPFRSLAARSRRVAVAVTEALVHGTLPWRGDFQRRTAFFKFNPVSRSAAASSPRGRADPRPLLRTALGRLGPEVHGAGELRG